MALAFRQIQLQSFATSARSVQVNAAMSRPVAFLYTALQPSTSFKRARASPYKRIQRQGLPVFASWGAEVEFSSARVLESDTVGENLQRILVDIGAAASAYTKPGQFIQAKVSDSKPGFFALASPPDSNNAGVIELLIKNQGGTAELMCSASAGAEVLVSSPMGKGFPIDKIPADQFPTVYIFATGSGISPIKALIESGALNASQRKNVILYYGAFNPSCMAYQDRIPVWENEYGVKVVKVFSDSGDGWVQDAFVKSGGVSDPKGVACVLVGQKEMCQALTEIFTNAGVDKEHVLLNF